MDATRTGPMALAERRLAWLEQRQRVLAQNIANADTPGYQPRDATPFARVLAGAQPELARTSPRHLDTPGGSRTKRDRAAETAPDGNAVSLDREALKVAETDQAHALALSLHRRWAAMFRTALGRNG
ncbi:flagellar basal body rod protein FlgB [Falsiroseomonas sp. CW058]|uniref:flagellar basal body rod protein FlgB n=1 Tax=Falsiroseomonas sp. CW058 TaxID=3388664 RepID=UPI003D31B51D